MRVIFVSMLLIMLSCSILKAQPISLDDTLSHVVRAVENVLPHGTNVAIFSFTSPSTAFSDFVVNDLTSKLIAGKKVTVVDRRNLSLINQEMDLQLSGIVSDESVQTIGKMLGAQSIISGSLINMGTYYRFNVSVTNVETAEIQDQISLDLQKDTQVVFLLEGSIESSQSSAIDTPSSSIDMENTIIVTGANLTEKLAWVKDNVKSHGIYIVEVTANEIITPHILKYDNVVNITIILRGIGGNRTIRISSNGSFFKVYRDVTFILDNNITLLSHPSNNNYFSPYDALITVNGGSFVLNEGCSITGSPGWAVSIVASHSGVFTMNGGSIIKNSEGVIICEGSFIMHGGAISENELFGVRVINGDFTMNGGSIDNNGNTGITLGSGGFSDDPNWYRSFTMNGGNIFNNKGSGVSASESSMNMISGTIHGNIDYTGGGVCIHGGLFTMSGGSIYENIARGSGGGVYIGSVTTSAKRNFFNQSKLDGVFEMNGGEIYSNTAGKSGGGVYIEDAVATPSPFDNIEMSRPSGKLIKTRGSITGYNTDQKTGNVVRDEEGPLARRGHAIFAEGNPANRKETTVGLSDKISYTNGKPSGSWDN